MSRRRRAPTPAQLLEGEQSEEAFLQQVIQYAELRGFRAYHTRDSRGSVAGFPDLLLLRPPRLVVLELKTTTGRVEPAQLEWLAQFRRIPGVEVALVRPPDWPMIERWLE